MANKRSTPAEPEENKEASENLVNLISPEEPAVAVEEPVDEGNDRKNLTYAVQGISEQLEKTRTEGQPIGLLRSQRGATPEILLWDIIKSSTAALSFGNYRAFMDRTLCSDEGTRAEALESLEEVDRFRLGNQRSLPFTDTDAYRLLKAATEAFLMVTCGVVLKIKNPRYRQLLDYYELIDQSGKTAKQWWKDYLVEVNGDQEYITPYMAIIKEKLNGLPIKDRIFNELALPISDGEKFCYGILREKLFHPCMIELIWSYWHEQGMLVQTMNALSKRFQNVRGPAERDPLAMIELDPLRPLNNLLWGYIQDEQHRLTVVRRAYEYDHHYGLALDGKAIPAMRTADSRSKFIEAFHHLLYLAAVFYKQDNDTTVIADGYPLLMGLRDLHLILSEGAHNQYGDLPSTARIEMLMQQWLLARPEFRETLPTRVMVAYPEPWMDRVDAMKRLQGWSDISSMHFHNLGVYGEQILLSVRFTRWSAIEEEDLAAAWARLFRSQVQGYIQAYLTVTGVDLAAEVTTAQQRELFTAQPSKLLAQRQPVGSTLPISRRPVHQTFRERRAERR